MQDKRQSTTMSLPADFTTHTEALSETMKELTSSSASEELSYSPNKASAAPVAVTAEVESTRVNTQPGNETGPQPYTDLGRVYQEKYSVNLRPEGLSQVLWCRVEAVALYLWFITQTLCLLVGLTVLHFTTFSAIVCYLVNGVARGRRELIPHKYQ